MGLSAGGTFDFLKPVCSVTGQLLQGFSFSLVLFKDKMSVNAANPTSVPLQQCLTWSAPAHGCASQ